MYLVSFIIKYSDKSQILLRLSKFIYFELSEGSLEQISFLEGFLVDEAATPNNSVLSLNVFRVFQTFLWKTLRKWIPIRGSPNAYFIPIHVQNCLYHWSHWFIKQPSSNSLAGPIFGVWTVVVIIIYLDPSCKVALLIINEKHLSR